MPTVYDLIAKISWETNQKELENIVNLSHEEAKVLEEMKLKSQKLSEQMIKTNDPKKVKQLNDELNNTKTRITEIQKSQEKQLSITENLKKKQSELLNEIKKTNDPQIMQGLLRNLKTVENQLNITNKEASNMPSKLEGIKKAFIGGIAGGLIGGGIAGMVTSGINFVANEFSRANEAFEQAEQSAIELNRVLKMSGNEKYFEGIIKEADTLVKSFRSFDNDDIVNAFGRLANTGKFTRQELSKLMPVILELSRAQSVDLASATDMVINILGGRGGAVLREYGLSLKGLKTDQEKLNFVIEELGGKVKGSNEIFEKTIRGQNEVISQEIDALETRIGRYTTNITMFFKKSLLGFFEFINDITKSAEDKKKERYDELLTSEEVRFGQLNEKEFNDMKRLTNLKIKETARYEEEVKKLKEKISPSNIIFSRDSKDYIEEVKGAISNYEELIDKNRAFIEAVAKEEAKRSDKNKKIGNKIDEEEEANEVKKIEKVKKSSNEIINIKDKEYQERLKKLEEYNQLELLSIERLNETGALTDEDYKDLLREREIAFLNEMLELNRKYGKETNKIETERIKKSLQLNEENKRRARKEALKTNATDGVGIFDAPNAIDVPDGFVSAFSKEIEAFKIKEGKKTNITKQGQEDRNKIAREELFYNIKGFAAETQNFIQYDIDKTNSLIEQQKTRLNEAKLSSTASVKIEEERLNNLIEKRQKYERAQRIIDATVIVANQAVAISGAIRQIATSKNYIETAANVIAIAAGIAASVSAVRNAFTDTGFYEGGYTGDGDPKEESTAIGRRHYKYHKREFVMNEKLTKKHRNMFEGLHKGELAVQEINGNYLLTPKLDVNSAIDDYISAKNFENSEMQNMNNQLSNIYKLLQQRELTVNNNFDADGFGQSIAGQMNRATIKQTLR